MDINQFYSNNSFKTKLPSCPFLLSSPESSDARVHGPSIRALFATASNFCEVGVLQLRTAKRNGACRWACLNLYSFCKIRFDLIRCGTCGRNTTRARTPWSSWSTAPTPSGLQPLPFYVRKHPTVLFSFQKTPNRCFLIPENTESLRVHTRKHRSVAFFRRNTPNRCVFVPEQAEPVSFCAGTDRSVAHWAPTRKVADAYEEYYSRADVIFFMVDCADTQRYRGTSLIRNTSPVEPYSISIPGGVW